MDAAPKTISAEDLLAREFAPVRYVIPPYVAEGLTLLAGAPKVGKSWLALDMAVAVAGGMQCLGHTCATGSVLYLGLEDNERRLQARMNRLVGTGRARPLQLTFATRWPRIGDGGAEEIESWIRKEDSARLVVVDVLAMMKPIERRKNSPQYDADYGAVKALQAIASTHNIAILVIHHTRKMRSEADALENISGTLGLSGAADSVLILDRGPAGSTLYGRGRDIEEIETAISFDREACRWIAQGPVAEVRRSEQRSKIIALLNESDEPMSPTEIAAELGATNASIRKLLSKMVADGEVRKAGRGRYEGVPNVTTGAAGHNESHNPERPDGARAKPGVDAKKSSWKSSPCVEATDPRHNSHNGHDLGKDHIYHIVSGMGFGHNVSDTGHNDGHNHEPLSEVDTDLDLKTEPPAFLDRRDR